MNKYLCTLAIGLITVAAFAQPQRGSDPVRGLDDLNGAPDSFVPVAPLPRVEGEAGRGRAGGPGTRGGEVFQQEVPAGMAAAFSPQTNRIFASIDTNGDGVISKAERLKAAASLLKLDADGDGNITLAEVSSGMPDPAQMIDQMFAQNDKNGDGKLTVDEMPDGMAQMFKRWDTNNDGAVTRDEIKAATANLGVSFNGPGGAAGGGGGPNAPVRGAFDPQQQMGQQMMQQMMAADRNGDGRLTPDEVPPQMRAMLQGADRNGDGAIDAAEMQAYVRQIGQRMGQRMRGGEGGAGDLGQPPREGRGPGRGN